MTRRHEKARRAARRQERQEALEELLELADEELETAQAIAESLEGFMPEPAEHYVVPVGSSVAVRVR